jgi:hypothetical protein
VTDRRCWGTEDFRLIVTDEGVQMSQNPQPQVRPPRDSVKDVRRATRKHHSAEDKIRIVLAGPRGEASRTGT